ncbi:MAG TPA: hypothetical protein PLR99_10965 [Polyangiaceae bacterium]|nr:hypothetical protein [Polyangiaceae bacterium]
MPHSRSSRAAMVFGTATMVTAIACGGTVETTDSGTGPTPTPTATTTNSAGPVYGAPVDASPPPADASPPPKDAAPDSPIAPAYGAPPDAAVPPYGAPPPRDAGP